MLCCQQLLLAQTCCSGGVPVSNNLGFPNSEKGTWQFLFNYDHNVLETLKEESFTLNDDSRRRLTQSILLKADYSFSQRFAAELFFSYVRQERVVNKINLTETTGIGDAVLLLKYRITNPNNDRHVFQLGLGGKVPLGASDLRSEQGIALNADLQPGSGAWDALLWTQYTHQLQARPSLTLSANAIYTLKGKNNDYFDTQVYQFGNDLQFILNMADQLYLGKLLFQPLLRLRYRKAFVDEIDGGELPNTGGQWLFVTPGIGWGITPQFSFNANVELSIYAKVDGTQLSPSRRFNIGLYYRLQKTKKLNLK